VSKHNYLILLSSFKPKHVVSLNKDNNIRQLCFDSKEPLFNNNGIYIYVCVCMCKLRVFENMVLTRHLDLGGTR